MSQLPEDVEGLCAFSALEPGQYQTFEDEEPEAPFAETVASLAGRDSEADPLTFGAEQEPEVNQDDEVESAGIAALGRAAGTAAHPVIHARRLNGDYGNSVATVVDAHEGDPYEEGVSVRRVEPVKPSLAVLAASGGAGVSTVVTTLARLWSQNGPSVNLMDVSAPSLLPLHLGGRGWIEGVWSSLEDGPGSIRVAAPYHMIQWERTGPMLLDGGAVAPGLMPFDAAGMACLLIATPQLASTIRLGAAVARLKAEGAEVRVLINQSPTGEAGEQFLENIKKKTGATLLPMTIRRSDLVPQALEAGQTVAELAPDSDVAADFQSLATWLLPRIGVNHA